MKWRVARERVEGASSGVVVVFMLGISVVLTVVVLGWVYLTDLGDNPPGLFCDEAEIGVRTHQLLTGALPGFPLLLFYQHFAYVHLGSLPLYATAPFIAVLGVTDLAIRM